MVIFVNIFNGHKGLLLKNGFIRMNCKIDSVRFILSQKVNLRRRCIAGMTPFLHGFDRSAIMEFYIGIITNARMGNTVYFLDIGYKIGLRQVSPKAGHLILPLLSGAKYRVQIAVVDDLPKMNGSYIPTLSVSR